MPIEIGAPDGSTVRFPDGTPDDTIKQVMARNYGGPQAKPEMGWGDWLRGFGGSFAQGALLGGADEAGIVDPEFNRRFSEQYPAASITANVAGGIAPFVTPFGVGRALTAGVGRTIGSGNLASRSLRSAGLGSTIGTAQDVLGSEGDLAQRVDQIGPSTLTGAVVGGVIPPLGAGASAVGRAVAGSQTFNRLADRLRPAATEPPLPFSAFDPPPGQPTSGGAAAVGGGGPERRFVNDMTPMGVARGQEQAANAIRQGLEAEGLAPQQIADEIRNFQETVSRFNSNSYGQDVLTVGDLSPAMQRLLGTWARQNTDAARYIAQFLEGRQTGVTPAGANAQALGARGIPTRDPLGPNMTGAEAVEEFGPAFQRAPGGNLRTGLKNQQPFGHNERVMDVVKRALHVKDSDYHGHAPTAGGTLDDLERGLTASADRNYGLLRGRVGQGINIGRAITPVIEALEASARASNQPASSALLRAARLFRVRETGEAVSDIGQFDRYKRYLDAQIKGAFAKPETVPIGHELREFRDTLFAALRDSEDRLVRRVGRFYDAIRSDYHTRAERAELIEKYRKIWTGDHRTLLDEYRTLSSEDKKLARLGVLWGVDDVAGRTDVARNITGLFKTPKAREIAQGIVPSTKTATGRRRIVGGEEAEFANLSERLGQYLQYENRFPETRQTATGGSMTARNVNDDLMTIARQAADNVETLSGIALSSPSMYQLIAQGLRFYWNRSFGPSAAEAREGARMLLTANPAEREMALQYIMRQPFDRAAYFADRVNAITQRLAGQGATGAGAAAMPQPQPQAQPGGPMQL